MSYAERKKTRQESETNVGRHCFDWEEQHVPLLHSGFMEPTRNNKSRNTLFLSIWFQNGEYKCRLQDRDSDEKAFLAIGTLQDCFVAIEAAIEQNDLEWTPDGVARNGRYGT